MAFNLADMVANRPKQIQEENSTDTVYRDVFKLIPSKENFYGVKPERLRGLKNSIQLFGVMQDVLIEERDGEDYIISGHCRTMCCRMLVEEGHEEFRKINCKYTKVKDNAQKSLIEIEESTLDGSGIRENDDAISKLLERLAVIQANRFRDKSDWEKMREALDTEEIIKELKNLAGLKGQTRDIVRETIDVSNAQFGRYKNIINHLSEDLMAEFEDGGINISVANAAASLDPDYQKQAYDIFMKNKILTLPDLQLLKEQQEAEKGIPGQKTIEQATGQLRPPENDKPVGVGLQVERFFESLNKGEKQRILNRDVGMAAYLISMRHREARIRNGYFNFQADKEGITFNPGSDQECTDSWKGLVQNLIERFAKKQKPVKMVSIDAPEKPAKKEMNAGKCIHREGFNCTLEETQKVAAGNVEDCNGKCCWNCDKHGTCGYECNASAHRPEEQIGQEASQNEQEGIQPQESEEERGYLDYAANHLVLAWHEWFKENYQSRVADTEESITEIQSKIENQEEKTVHFETLKGTARLNFYDDCVVIRDERDKYAGDFEYAQLVTAIQREWQKIETEEESCQSAAETPDKKQQEDHSGDLTEMVKHLRNTDKIPDAWPEDLKDIPVPTGVEIIGYLYDEERRLKEFLETEKEDPGLPHMAILKQQLIVGGLRIIKNLVEDCKEEPEESEQPPLPIMRNNDQRKEWLKNYKAWGLWYTDNHTGVKYYKYDFENGARLIVEEYEKESLPENSWYVPKEPYYMHLIGGPEPDRKGGIPKWTYHSKYNKYPNSETELVEFLKEIQK